MNLTTSLKGRVSNTSLPKRRALLPLMEAVVNSLQAIDARLGSDVSGGKITITVERSAQQAISVEHAGPGRAPLEPIIGFVVRDNGIGFTEENMASFQMLDSDYKADLGCRGVGRLLWLKAFDRVEVDSAYVDAQGSLASRQFRFTSRDGVTQSESHKTAEAAGPGSCVKLVGFKDEYQRNAPKSAEPIARELLEHCLWYFVRTGGAPDVLLVDDETISLNALLEEYASGDLLRSHLVAKGVSFDMVSLRARSVATAVPRLYWCAASRVVADDNLNGRVAGLHGRLQDGDAEFTFICFVSSDYLDRNVRADRTAFDIPEQTVGTLAEDELALSEIRKEVLAEVERLLAEPLIQAREAGNKRLVHFVSTKAPRYRVILPRLQDAGISVDPNANDRDLELQLHKHFRDMEVELLDEGRTVLEGVEAGLDDEHQVLLQEYLAKVEDLKKSDLAAYVFRRKVMLDILSQVIQSTADGKYPREETVHTLLMPMRTDSNQTGPDASNLWIIDERLAFHDYLASDKSLRSASITGSESTKEPDILSTRLFDTPFLVSEGTGLPLASISVVEIKRPMRNDGTGDDKNPINQAVGYVELVRKGGVKTSTGRPIPPSPSIPGFCYVIADLTSSMVEHCKNADLRPTHDGMGYFGYNSARDAYIEVISFDKLVNAAKERNRAFFDKLGLPST